MVIQDKDIMDTVYSFFESGKNIDFVAMKNILADDPEFSSFGDVPPYGVQDAQTTIILEEMRLAAISDYNYEIHDEHITLLDDAAIVTFMLRQTGMLVDNKTFSGRIVATESRATFALTRKKSWKIIHIHISRIMG